MKRIIESILDDLLSDFDRIKPIEKDTVNTRVSQRVRLPQERERPPVRIKYKENPEVSKYKEYLRPESYFEKEMKRLTGKNKWTIEEIAKVYGEYNVGPDDTFEYMVDTDDLYKYREYDRNIENGYTSSGKTEKDFNSLKDDIKKRGKPRDAGWLRMERRKDGVYVHLGEGNHRLKAVRELGIKKIPIRFRIL